MKVPEIHIKKILFGLFIGILFLPISQNHFQFIELRPLEGDITEKEVPVFTWNYWFTSEFQDKTDAYINENFGFRNFFVRLYNQMHYSFFNNARAKKVVIGKEDFLYEEAYINSYLGRDFIGTDTISEKVRKLERISDTLKSKNIDLIVVVAPGKGRFYPQYIPEKFDPEIKTTTNYEVFRKKLEESTIQFLDFNQWFMQMKDTSRYCLYPKTGIHWSYYGEILVADSLINYISAIREIEDKPALTIERMEISSETLFRDGDMKEGMNIFKNIKDFDLAYPVYNIKKSGREVKVLSISDSFYWAQFEEEFLTEAFGPDEYWYYNYKIFPDSYHLGDLYVWDIDKKERLESKDVIILMITETNLRHFCFHFLKQTYPMYFSKES